MLSTLAVACLLVTTAYAQDAFAPPPTQSAPTSSTADTDVQSSPLGIGDTGSDQQDTSASASSSVFAQPSTLSADQIIQILQQSPDLVVEIKSQVADRLQQQGSQVDANDITDQMLYNQISTNADLRANVSTFLRARGYVSQGDLQSEGASAGGFGSEQGTTLPGDTNASQLGANGDLTTTGTSVNGTALGTALNARSTAGSISQRNASRNHENSTTSTDVPKVLRQSTPYNLQSLRDLYTQIPERAMHLKRFGSDVFLNRNTSAMSLGGSSQNTPLDVPLGPDYVVGPGDTLAINVWGGITQSVNRVVDRDGHVLLPEAGSLQVAGLSLGSAENAIAEALQRQYRDVKVSVTVARLHSVRVYVVGDVQRPGGYDISSLATPLSALFAAGGPTSVGSLRIARHYRGDKLVEEIDLYDFLLHGLRKGSAHFESGDTLLVPPAGPQVALSGAVKRPAIYELKAGETTLATALEYAGGVTVAASLSHITIERIDPNRQRATVTLSVPANGEPDADRAAINQFEVCDGDRIHVSPILPYSERVIYVQGHVVRPGRVSYTDGMRLSDVLHSYQDMLPEPAEHGEIIRLVPPDLHAETIDFSVPEVLIGNANIVLQPFDTVRIFGRYEVDSPKVTIHGEVLRAGVYPLSKDMTISQLVRMAGGFKRDALTESADLTSYAVAKGNHVTGEITTVRIGAAVAGSDPGADTVLKPGDILTIHQITGWNDIGQSITINGQVKFPGSYGFHEGERLSSVLRRAGGLRDTAYPEGAVLLREQVREVEEKSRDELIRQIETNSSSARLSPALAGDSGSALQLIKAQQQQALAQLKSNPPTGRMVIHIGADIDSWANTPADVELRRGDVLTIPKRPGFVIVSGEVYNATGLTFTQGKTAKWYLSRAGGTNAAADRKNIFIIRANGSVVGRHSGGWFDADVLSTRLDPGDVVVVPQKIIGASLFWKNLLATAQLASSIGITAGIAAAAL
ncbi:SLBB domain-containing protein [Granulicella sp. 5B5]|uniref:SLBB domain-containing protein n=1 Tax=Granulicella sp. 5B5 TaxID=1617967 RepID=UPI0015F38226|nr:SLBB domain-containing protein [Granulicella sp. 5B5]